MSRRSVAVAVVALVVMAAAGASAPRRGHPWIRAEDCAKQRFAINFTGWQPGPDEVESVRRELERGCPRPDRG